MIIGDQAYYTVVVRNTGDTAAQDVTVTDTLDPELEPGAAPDGCTVSGQTVTCEGITIPAGGSYTVRIPVTVDSDVSDGTNVRNRAEASSPSTGTVSTEAINQTRTLTDVEIDKSGTAEVQPDGSIVYTVVVTNHGPSDAVDVTVQDETNGNLTSIAQLPPECPASGLTITCPLGTLKPGESETLTFVLTAGSDLPAGTVIPNCAKVYTGSREDDTDNNESCTDTT
ncbi:DUF11 domain-containing protein, partial [Nonomuraea sp. NN258]|uniref:DUF11 domain-containing protein n=1 Tax=Nonomuraea antri TaxID=2730852 RepID=UPI001568AFC6